MTAATLTQLVRSTDVLCRVGGDEFAIILPNTDAHAAEAIAQRIRAARTESRDSIGAMPLDVSLGVAPASRGEVSLSELVRSGT